MPELAAVDAWIMETLKGSGLSLKKRTEVFDEWRHHLLASIEAKRQAHMPTKAAVQASLAEFGDQHRLRRWLRRWQRTCDFRHALHRTRSHLAVLYASAATVAVLVAFILRGPASPWYRLAGGTAFAIAFALFTLLCAVSANLVEIRITRCKPKDEFRPWRSYLRWTCVVAAFLTGTLLMAPAAVVVVGYAARDAAILSVLHPGPEYVHVVPWQFLRYIGVAATKLPLRSLLLPIVVTLAGAAVMTWYERTRCVETSSASVGVQAV